DLPSVNNSSREMPCTSCDSKLQSVHCSVPAGETRWLSIDRSARLHATSIGYEFPERLEASKSRNEGMLLNTVFLTILPARENLNIRTRCSDRLRCSPFSGHRLRCRTRKSVAAGPPPR